MQNIYNASIRYLSRYNASEKQLKEYLKRKFSQKIEQFDEKSLLAIEKLKKENFLNDNRFTENKIRIYLESGKSFYYIKMKMLEKGISEQTLGEEITKLEKDKEELELHAAIKFVRKNKIKPFGIKEGEKEIAKMLRNGFNYKQVKQILESTQEELEKIEQKIQL